MQTGATIEQLIGLPSLLGLMNETTSGVPDPIPDAFDKPKIEVLGNSARLFIGYGQRKTSRFIKYNAPSVSVGLENLAAKDFIIHSTSEVQPIDPATYEKLHNFDNFDMQKQGAGEVARQIGLFKTKFDNTRKVTKWSVLRYGKVWADALGNILPTSSGAAADYTIDFGVPAGHTGQLDVFATGDIIDASWDVNTTNIPKHIELIHQAAAIETGLPIKYAFYGPKVPGAIRKNTLVQPFLPFDPMARELNRSTTLPKGLLGLEWIPLSTAFFEDSTNTNRVFFDENMVIFTPDPEKGNWWKLIEGSQRLPNTIDVTQRTIQDIQATSVLKYGQWACAQYQFHGGLTLLNYLGDNFMYALQNPKAIFQATVIF